MKRSMLSAIALAAAIGSAGCKGSDATAPKAAQPPAIASLAVAKVGDVFLRASLTADVTDPDRDITTAVVDWGDNSTTTLTTGFAAIARVHDYSQTGTYTVTLTALDAAGNRVSSNGSVRLDPAPHGCFDVQLVGVCYTTHPDYLGADLSISVLGTVVQQYNLSTTKNRIEAFVPVGGLLGQVKLVFAANFSRTKGASYVQLDEFGCTLFAICTNSLATQKIPW
jgi:PKD domain